MFQKANITVFRVCKSTGYVEMKSFDLFDKALHNSNKEKYYYFNYNHPKQLWEHDYCQNLTPQVLDSFRKAKNKKFIVETYITHIKDLTLIADLDYKLKNIQKENAKERYEQSVSKLKEKFPSKTKRLCNSSNI